MSNKIKKNYILSVSYQLFAIIVPLITTPYISRVLKADGIGIYSFTYAIIKYFMLVGVLGTGSYGIREIGKYQDDLDKRSQSFWNIFLFKLFSMSIMIVLYLLYVTFFANDKTICYIQGLYLIGALFDIAWFYQGIEDLKKITIRNFLIKIINVIFIFAFIKDRSDLWLYVLGLAFFNVIGNLSMWINLRKHIKKPDFKNIRVFSSFKEILQLFIPAIAIQIFSVLDKTVIGIFDSTAIENGYYEQSLKIIDMSLSIVTALSAVMIPGISKEYHKNNKEVVKDKMIKSYKFVFMLTIPMMFGIIGIADKLVPIFFGDGYEKLKLLLPLLSLLYIPMCLNYITGMQYLVSTGQQNKYSKYLLIGGIINIVLNIILVPKLFSIGAAIGSIVGEIISMLICMGYLKRTKQFDFKIFPLSWKYLISGLIVLMYLISLHFVHISNFLFIVIGMVGSMIIYLLLLILFKDDMVLNTIVTMKRKLKLVK